MGPLRLFYAGITRVLCVGYATNCLLFVTTAPAQCSLYHVRCAILAWS